VIRLWAVQSCDLITARARDLPLHQNDETGSGAHLTSYFLGTGENLPSDKAAWTWSWPLPPRSVKEKNVWIYTPSASLALWTCTYTTSPSFSLRLDTSEMSPSKSELPYLKYFTNNLLSPTSSRNLNTNFVYSAP